MLSLESCFPLFCDGKYYLTINMIILFTLFENVFLHFILATNDLANSCV